MALSSRARAAVQWVVDYLRRSNPPDTVSIDEESARKLSQHYAEFCHTSQISMMEALRDAPTLTVAQMLLCVAGSEPVPPPEPVLDGYILRFYQSLASATNPGNVQYFSFSGLMSFTDTFELSKIPIPVSGTIKRIDFKSVVGGTLGSGELITHAIRLNDTTDVGSIQYAYTAIHNAGSAVVDQAVVAGDFICPKITYPASFVTPPGSIRVWAQVFIEYEVEV